MRKTSALICLLLCFLLTACGTAPQDAEGSPQSSPTPPSADTADANDIGRFLGFGRDAITETEAIVAAEGTEYIRTGMYADEQSAVLDLLFAADADDFTDSELPPIPRVMGNVSLILHTEHGERVLDLVAAQPGGTGEATLTLTLQDASGAWVIKQAPTDAVDYDALRLLMMGVKSCTDDPDHSGTVSLPAPEHEGAVDRANSAQVRHMLDKLLTAAGTADEAAGSSYDVEFRLGECTYQISSETGHFCRELAGEQLYGQLSADSGPVSGGLSPLMQVLGRLGVAKLLGK